MTTQPLSRRHRRSVCALTTVAAVAVVMALAPPAQAKGSRSKSQLVYAGDTERSTGQIFVARPGGKRRQVTSGPNYLDLPRWSPHGRRILYRDYGKGAKRLYPFLMVMGADGRHKHKVLGGPRLDIIDYAWGPSGRRIAVSVAIDGGPAAGNDLFLYSLRSKKLQRLHVDIPDRIPSTLDWSRDGKHIVFAGLDNNGDDGWNDGPVGRMWTMLEDATQVGFVGVSDLDAAHRFYGEVLGLVLQDARPFALVHESAATQLRITLVEEVIAAPYTVLGWSVTDLDGEIDRLVASGVAFNRYDGMDQDARGIWTSPSGARIAWFHDPDGNNLSQPGADAPGAAPPGLEGSLLLPSDRSSVGRGWHRAEHPRPDAATGHDHRHLPPRQRLAWSVRREEESWRTE